MKSKLTSKNNSGLSQILRWPTARAMKWTREFLAAAATDPNIMAVVAVGSAVRPNVASVDLDLIVICRENNPLAQKPPIEVDLRAYSAAEIDAKIREGHDLLVWSIMFGRVLFQRDSFWDSLTDKWEKKLPLPSSRLARDRAAAVYRRLSELIHLGDENATHDQLLSYLTHRARFELLKEGIYPASRPELPTMLRLIGKGHLAHLLDTLLRGGGVDLSDINELLESSEEDLQRV
jgi:hypothetical protein